MFHEKAGLLGSALMTLQDATVLKDLAAKPVECGQFVPQELLVGVVGAITSYAKYHITWEAGEVKFYREEVLQATHNDDIPDEAMVPAFWSANVAEWTYIDWVFYRNWVDPQPTHTSWGLAETFQDLAASFIIRGAASEDLLGIFKIRKPDSEELLGIFTIPLSTNEELFAEFVIDDTHTITGITKDTAGNRLGNCEVALFRVEAGVPPDYTFIEAGTSDGNGDYTFTGLTKRLFFVRAQKDGVPNVFDTTDNELEPV